MKAANGFHVALGLNGVSHKCDADIQDPDTWVEVVQTAEAGLLDFVTFDDAFAERNPRRAMLDATLLAAAIAPATRHIGLIPAVAINYKEPFHVSTAIATLDYASEGRAGWQPVVLPPEWVEIAAACAGHSVFGLPYESPEALYCDAADAVEAVRRLWDSWEDDAVIRDVPTGRFIDRSKLHSVDFRGAYFSVGAASIIPRPPQGQPVVAVEGRDGHGIVLAACQADVVFLPPRSASGNEWSTRLCGWDAADERDGSCRAYADILVAFENDADVARPAFRGTPAALVDYLIAGRRAGWQGVRLKPHDLQRDVASIVEFVVPELQAAGIFRTTYDASTLRNRLALPVAINRYEIAS